MPIEPVIPMEGLGDPMKLPFLFKATNVTGIVVYVGCELITPPAGWANFGEMQCGTLEIGEDDYFIYDTPTRTKPATNTEENVTFRVTYYSDAYITEVHHEDIVYTFTYVDFDDVSYAVVDEDTFEADLEGWAKVDEVGVSGLAISTDRARTGLYSMKHSPISAGEIGYATKSFTISGGAVSRAFIRIWLYVNRYTSPGEAILELITDAGEVSQIRTLPMPMDFLVKGGSEIMDQWLVIAAKLPVDGTYEVRLRVRGETDSVVIYYDDIKVVES